MIPNTLMGRVTVGAAAGVAGTMVMQQLRGMSTAHFPETVVPARRDPGEFMVEKAEKVIPEPARDRIPDAVERVAVRSLHVGYGTTFGALYGALRPPGGHRAPVLEGTMLGIAAWAVGYLGWLPATGLTKAVPQQQLTQTIGEIVRHALFGIAVAVAYDALAGRVTDTETHPSEAPSAPTPAAA